MTLESTPSDVTHWSTRDLAKRIGVSQSTVSRVWRAFNPQPHRVDTFRLSNDPLFIEKVRDIVGLYTNLSKRPRFHVHYTTTYSSWLNLVERWFAILSEHKIKRASGRSTRELERDIREFLRHNNQHRKLFIWTKSADQILASVRRFCQYTLQAHGKEERTLDSGH